MELQNQKSNVTHYNRYPKIFSGVADIVKLKQGQQQQQEQLKILSFGCSSGEEVRTLRELYFPSSYIYGVDICESLIASNKVNNIDKMVEYFTPVELKNSISSNNKLKFDIIFCMSVLCSFDSSDKSYDDISSKYPFDVYEYTVNDLNDMLNVGGYLVIYNSNYYFEDTEIAKNYEAVRIKGCNAGFVPKFHKDYTRQDKVPSLFIYSKLN